MCPSAAANLVKMHWCYCTDVMDIHCITCIYFLGGNLKKIVYRTLSITILGLEPNIRDEVSYIEEDTLWKVLKNMENRIFFVLRENGGHFEYPLN